METSELKPIIEAMIFVADEPITENGILLALQETGVEKNAVRECIASIEKDWNESAERGVHLATVAGGYQFRTKPSCSEWLRKINVPKPMRLSAPSLETLAIVAYKQPIVRSEIEKVRGVDSGGVLKTLLDRRLLRIVGRKDEPGQPLLYGTTKEFLEIFNMNTLRELPTLKDVDDLLRERRTQTDSREPVPAALDDSVVDDGDEPTEVIVDDEALPEGEPEESAELIRAYPLEADKEAECKDMEALDDLEQSLKSLRRIEKDIFPKEAPQLADLIPGGSDAAETFGAQGEAESEIPTGEENPFFSAQDGSAAEDAPAEDDRSVE
ncbi:MAG TPA: SMC-Scp complex subunit ScpB [bacterium]|nr:SMC-Scp complex subunit ScpB [Myxococcales bacterium]HQC50541.1 SMC-Scp complex subunit ScpB [bacterium]